MSADTESEYETLIVFIDGDCQRSSLLYFPQHRGSKACKKKEQRRQAAMVTREAQMVLSSTMVRVLLHIIFYFNLYLIIVLRYPLAMPHCQCHQLFV